MKYFLHISFLLSVFGSVYTMQEITPDIFNDHRNDFKGSVGRLYWKLKMKNSTPNWILRQLPYSEQEIKFAVILDRYFVADYKAFIYTICFNDVNQMYANLVLQELDIDKINEHALISVFRQHLKLCCGKRLDEDVSVDELCNIANDSEQMSYDAYMTRMTLNLFIRYWLQQQNLI